MSFIELKKNRSASIAKLAEAAEKISAGNYTPDERIWAPTVDKAGNGYAVIRFLPAPEGESVPWIRYWDHGFKGPTGKWYIENSLSSLGKEDPCGVMNARLWNTGNEKDKELVRARKRRLHYVSNVLVVSDPANPANDGKIFLFKYGKKIFDKVLDLMNPEFEDEKPINPFDLWEGADFKIKIRNVEGYRNYDKSDFDSPTALFDGDDAKLEDLYKRLFKLQEFLDPKNFKSYQELEKKLVDVLGAEAVFGAGAVPSQTVQPVSSKTVEAAAKPEAASIQAEDAGSDEEDEGSLSYFAKLARGES